MLTWKNTQGNEDKTFKLADMYGKSVSITTWKLVTQPANGGGEQPSN